jgi:hypothetical protein
MKVPGTRSVCKESVKVCTPKSPPTTDNAALDLSTPDIFPHRAGAEAQHVGCFPECEQSVTNRKRIRFYVLASFHPVVTSHVSALNCVRCIRKSQSKIWEQFGNKTRGVKASFRASAPTKAVESSSKWRKRVGVEPNYQTPKSRRMMALRLARSSNWSQLESGICRGRSCSKSFQRCGIDFKNHLVELEE